MQLLNCLSEDVCGGVTKHCTTIRTVDGHGLDDVTFVQQRR
jgi:hypothetical protein